MRTSQQPLLRLALALICALPLIAACTSEAADDDAAQGDGSSEPMASEVPAVDTSTDESDPLARAIAESEVDCDTIEPWSTGTDLLIWVEGETSVLELDGIRDELQMSELVETFLYVDQDTVLVEFQEFYADRPGLRDSIAASDLPTRFEVSTEEPAVDNAAVLQREYEARSIIEGATAKPQRCAVPGLDTSALCAEFGLPSPATVFMEPEATTATIDRIEALIVATGLFETVSFTSQEDARASFDEVMSDFEFDDELAADILGETQASDLPASFEVEVVRARRKKRSSTRSKPIPTSSP